jgi:hypothetical protein
MRIGRDDLTLDGTNMAVNITSEPVYLGHICNYSIQLVFTGSPGGNFKLQMSNDEGNPSAPKESDRDFKITNWTDIADSAVTISAAGDLAYNYRDAGYRWVRVLWTQTSGSGTLVSAVFNVKGI